MALERISKINDIISGIVWGPFTLIFIVGVGVYLSIRTGFIQATKFEFMWRSTVGSIFQKGEAMSTDGTNVSPFQAVSTALASTVGMGNVAGVAGAIALGGPGAIFWMWVSAFFGMITKYSEIVLSVKYRQTDIEGKYYGGPMYYIEKGLNMKWLAILFSFFGGLCCFGIGNATQASEIAVAINNLTGSGFDSSLTTAIILAAITAIVIIGGIGRIAAIASYLVPIMSAFYTIGALIIIIMNFNRLPYVLGLIFRGAFSNQAAAGGAAGTVMMLAMQKGVARGIFSNEAGLGSAPIAHAASSVKDPVKQGLWGIFEVFLDTIVMCTITGLVVIIAGIYDQGLTTGALSAASFEKLLPFGGTFVCIALSLFALATILGWSYYGERCWAYLFNNSKIAELLFKLTYVLFAFVGAATTSTDVVANTAVLNLAWNVADTLNGLMAIPNLIALLLLSGTVISVTRDFFGRGRVRASGNSLTRKKKQG